MDKDFELFCCKNLVPADLKTLCWEVWQAARVGSPVGYVNERMLSVLGQGMTACTHISPRKTEYARVPIFAEVRQ